MAIISITITITIIIFPIIVIITIHQLPHPILQGLLTLYQHINSIIQLLYFHLQLTPSTNLLNQLYLFSVYLCLQLLYIHLVFGHLL